MTQNQPNLNIWGKTTQNDTYYPLLAHLLDTVVVMGHLYENWLSDNLRDQFSVVFGTHQAAKQHLQLAAGLHDIGKITPIFQAGMLNTTHNNHQTQQALLASEGLPFPDLSQYDTDSLRTRKLHRHEKLGHWLLSNQQDTTAQLISSQWLTTAVLGHHGSFDISYAANRRNQDQPKLTHLIPQPWITQAQTHQHIIEELTGVTLPQAHTITVPNHITILISGLVILADRIASNNTTINNNQHLHHLPNPHTYTQHRTQELNTHTQNTVGYPTPLTSTQILQGKTPHGVQTQPPTGSGLWLITSPTGTGKTEAALLRHATNPTPENLIFLLPTKSTTNAMFTRIQTIYKDHPTTLANIAHGDARLNTFHNNNHNQCDDGGLAPSLLTNAGARLSAPVVIATIDQLVMGSLPLKWTHLRLLTLANAHIIIDEAHLMDTYQLTLTQELFTFLKQTNTRITILSATLPQQTLHNLLNAWGPTPPPTHTYPAHYHHQQSTPLTEHPIPTTPYTAHITQTQTTNPTETHTQWVKTTLQTHPQARVGVFVNTVTRAQEIAQELQTYYADAQPPVKIICLNSRMLNQHKQQTLNTILTDLNSKTGQGERTVLIGTQLIEMSLDVDLDLITTDIAPASSLIQRIGRVWRNPSEHSTQARNRRLQHNPTSIPIHIATHPEDDETRLNLPYPVGQLQRATNNLQTLHNDTLNFPQDIQTLINTNTPTTPDEEDHTTQNQAEYVEELFKAMKALNTRSKLLDFLQPTQTLTHATNLTHSTLNEDTQTRLIDGTNLSLILQTTNPTLQKLGALPPTPTQNLKTLPTTTLLNASIPLNHKTQHLLNQANITPLKINTHTYAYTGELPPTLTYHPLTGLQPTQK